MGAGASLLVLPVDRDDMASCVESLTALQRKLESSGAWTAQERTAVRGALEHSRGVYSMLIDQAPAHRDALKKLRAELLTNFSRVYQSVYENLLAKEPGFAEFNTQADRCASSAPRQKPRQTTQRLEQLYETGAVGARAPFASLLDAARGALAGASISVAPLKKMSRAIEKSMLRAEAERRGEVDGIVDVVRGMVTCGSMSELGAALTFFSEANHGWKIVRVKNRFAGGRTSGGWADCLLNIVRSDDPHQHVCEVQLVHEKMLLLRKQLGGHDAYHRYRTADELLIVLAADLEELLIAGLEKELTEAKGNRDGKKCKEIKGRIEEIKAAHRGGILKINALQARIIKLTAEEEAAFDNDDFDEGDRLHAELEARKAELQEQLRQARQRQLSVEAFDPSKLAELRTLKGHSDSVYCVAISPDGRRVVSGSADETLKVWDVATGKCVATLKGHSNWVTSVAVFPDGRRVVSGSWDTTLKVWDVATGECVATLEGHSSYVFGVAISPDGRRVVSGSYDETLKVWDVATGKCVATLQGHSRDVNCVAISPDGRRVVSGSDDETLKVWDVATGECVATLEGHSRAVYGVAVFPDGRRVVSGSDDSTVKVWDVATGKCVATLEGHSGEVRGVAVFPDGRRVVSASADKTLKVWDVATGECVATLEGHSRAVYGVAVFPDGRCVVSGSKDETLKLWGIKN